MTIVIFDMDGTLIDSQNDITTSINHVRQHNHGLDPLHADFVVEAINMDERNLPQLFITHQAMKIVIVLSLRHTTMNSVFKTPDFMMGFKNSSSNSTNVV